MMYSKATVVEVQKYKARLEVQHSLYTIEQETLEPIGLPHIGSRSDWWPVGCRAAWEGYPGWPLPEDLKIGDEVEVYFAYAGYWAVVNPHLHKTLGYQDWKKSYA